MSSGCAGFKGRQRFSAMCPYHSAEWRPGPLRPRLASEKVDVWRVPLDQPQAVYELLYATLSEDERDRAARFRFAHLRRNFAMARGALRAILAAYLDAPPGSLTFAYGEHGKPWLAVKGGQQIEFNVSHSGRLALVAVTQAVPVGIDVEQTRPVPDVAFLAQRYLAPAEWKAIEHLRAAEQEAAFLACWTRKEAYLKAHGEGLAGGLARTAVLPAARGLHVSVGGRDAPECWVGDLAPQEGYVAALALIQSTRGTPRMSHWHWNLQVVG
jgi:4'-phosphopantetheinyl transferase